jgi:hypothetical protein
MRIRMGLMGSTFVLGEEVELISPHLATAPTYSGAICTALCNLIPRFGYINKAKSKYSDNPNSTVDFYLLPTYIKPLGQSRSGCFRRCWYVYLLRVYDALPGHTNKQESSSMYD